MSGVILLYSSHLDSLTSSSREGTIPTKDNVDDGPAKKMISIFFRRKKGGGKREKGERKGPVHGLAHDVGENSSRASYKCSHDGEQVVVQHETLSAKSPSAI